jgi:hypothetical protein
MADPMRRTLVLVKTTEFKSPASKAWGLEYVYKGSKDENGPARQALVSP